MKTKRGQTPNTLITLVVIVAVAVIVIVAVAQIIKVFKESDEIEKCRSSVLLIDRTITQVGGLTFDTSPASLNCPRIDKTLRLKEVERNGKIDSNLINREMAESQRVCWYKLGEGNLYAFEKEFLGSEDACVICGKLDFEEELISEYQKQYKSNEIKDYDAYIKDTKIDGGEITYLGYLSERRPGSTFLFAWNENEKKLKDITSYSLAKDGKSSTYYSVYRFAEPEFFTHLNFCLVTTLVGFVVPGWSIPTTGLCADYLSKDVGQGIMIMVESEDLDKLECGVVYQ